MDKLATRWLLPFLASLVLVWGASRLDSLSSLVMTSGASPSVSEVRPGTDLPLDRSASSNAQPKRASSAIAVTPDGSTLLVVNPDSNSVTLVDTISLTCIAEILVGIDPRTVSVDDAGERAYVANRLSGSVSVIDLASRTVNGEVVVGNRLYGVVVSPFGDRLYVAVKGPDQVLTLDTSDPSHYRVVPLFPNGAARRPGLPGRAFAKVLRDVVSGEYPMVSYWKQALIISDNRIPAFGTDASVYSFAVPAPQALSQSQHNCDSGVHSRTCLMSRDGTFQTLSWRKSLCRLSHPRSTV